MPLDHWRIANTFPAYRPHHEPVWDHIDVLRFISLGVGYPTTLGAIRLVGFERL
ncbi:hypothetical protein [Proteus myxofaciens]|uniref:hypothetical protein n=1 Tax=Proteus myxofaciens TaxID=184072 RepID=UPI001FDFD733|nr:hypothetical protein [Proteus myxofaciens]